MKLCEFRVLAKCVELFEMIDKSTDHGLVFIVRKIEFLSCVSDDIRDLLIMDMRNVRENMMLYLMVQASREEIHKFVVNGKVRSRIELMDCPGVLHHPVFVGLRHFCVRHDMGQLENDTEDHSRRVMHDEEPDQDLPPWDIHNQYGKYDPNRIIEDFGHDKNRPLLNGIWKLSIRQLPLQVTAHLFEIGCYRPVDRQQAVQENRVVLLEFVYLQPLATSTCMRRDVNRGIQTKSKIIT